ncbi:MAG: hypothetical protein WC327_01135 [Candidatus Cloacimonadia bacterium]
MSFKKYTVLLATLLLLAFAANIFAAAVEQDDSVKLMDISKNHDVGNIWLRVSNFGFFGSGNNRPMWPSLEYPGGSGIDYLYQGALWFGAKKIRRDAQGRKLFWNPSLEDAKKNNDPSQVIAEGSKDYDPLIHKELVVDTLVTVGFDGDAPLYEFLPAYNPLETNALGTQYTEFNLYDKIMTQSIRTQRAGVDDDGDGLIDEDPIGMAFPFRAASELPDGLAMFGNTFLHAHDPIIQSKVIEDNIDIWFPLGFTDLGQDPSGKKYNYTMPTDDDGDGLVDEDGAPVSEQDHISYYYDFSPFGTPGRRNWGMSASGYEHVPLNVMVRQLSYQWSYEYIKNLVYVEFNITNMNQYDSLFDCTMAIYMDCDVGPQAWDDDTRSLDDVSGYVAGSGYEFAYTRDFDGDGGLTPGWIGARVCTPDPEQLDFACWTWKRGSGPDDRSPRSLTPRPGKKTANEKYWLMTGRNPNPDSYQALRPEGWTPDMNPHYEEPEANDTRFLFAFYGDMQGMSNPTDTSWNLAPGRTMKIVVAVFPGESLEELKESAVWAKDIYGEAQTLETVILPDINPHYIAPEPPVIPKMYSKLAPSGNEIEVYWDNRAEFSLDRMVVSTDRIGWQTHDASIPNSYVPNYPFGIPEDEWPDEFKPPVNIEDLNANAIVNPWVGDRLRHDFQGYSLYGRSGTGTQDNWMLINKWDKVDTSLDLEDYDAGMVPSADLYLDYGGYLGIDKGLPNERAATDEDTDYYYLDEFYQLSKIKSGQTIYGHHLYNSKNYTLAELDDIVGKGFTFEEEALLFKNPDLDPTVYLELYDDSFIPLPGHAGQWAFNGRKPEDLEGLRRDRLSRRYYRESIMHPPKGIEYYIAVTAWDRGMPDRGLEPLESGRDADANMKVLFPGPSAQSKMDNIYVVPNPYFGLSKFDGRREGDMKGDRSKRIWFVNLPERATINIYTLAGDLVDTIEHYGSKQEDIITISRAARHGLTASGMASWDVLSRHSQILAPGVYLYSVKDHKTGETKVDKFVIIQ